MEGYNKKQNNATNYKYNTDPILNNPQITTNNAINNKTDTTNYKHNTKIRK